MGANLSKYISFLFLVDESIAICLFFRDFWRQTERPSVRRAKAPRPLQRPTRGLKEGVATNENKCNIDTNQWILDPVGKSKTAIEGTSGWIELTLA